MVDTNSIEGKVGIEITPALSSALQEALWDWHWNREFLSESAVVARIVQIVQEKGHFYFAQIELDQSSPDPSDTPCP